MSQWNELLRVDERVSIDVSYSDGQLIEIALKATLAGLVEARDPWTESAAKMAIFESEDVSVSFVDEPEEDIISSIGDPVKVPSTSSNGVVYSMDMSDWQNVLDQINGNREAYAQALSPYRITGKNAIRKIEMLAQKIVKAMNQKKITSMGAVGPSYGKGRGLGQLKMREHTTGGESWEEAEADYVSEAKRKKRTPKKPPVDRFQGIKNSIAKAAPSAMKKGYTDVANNYIDNLVYSPEDIDFGERNRSSFISPDDDPYHPNYYFGQKCDVCATNDVSVVWPDERDIEMKKLCTDCAREERRRAK